MAATRSGSTTRLNLPVETGFSKGGPLDRDIEQAITALKKGATLLKYGRRGKPKFCPFKLNVDETELVWYSGSQEKTLRLTTVGSITPGQKTAVFQRYPRPDKEYQSFSLIYQNGERSLDLICKDRDEAEIWFMGLKALLKGAVRKSRVEPKGFLSSSLDSPIGSRRETSPLASPIFEDFNNEGSIGGIGGSTESLRGLGSPANMGMPHGGGGSNLQLAVISNSEDRGFRDRNFDSDDGLVFYNNNNSSFRGMEASRASVSSQMSTSSQGSGMEDSETLGDVFMWGEGVGDGILGGGIYRIGCGAQGAKLDALTPKALESTMVLDVQNIACGGRHAVLVNKQGEVFAWGEESLGRLGHGVDTDVPTPQLVESLSSVSTEIVACGEYHTCAVTQAGELYTWGMGTSLALGHGNDFGHWIPKRIDGPLDNLRIGQVACGPWHMAAVTTMGQLFTWGDGTFGALGHGDRSSSSIPKEVDTLRGLRTVRVACGVWHTAAVVEVMAVHPKDDGLSDYPSGKIFTWGDGDKGRLGHGDKQPRWSPTMVASTVDYNFCQVACGHSLTIALSTAGSVFACGSSVFGQLGNPQSDGKNFAVVEGKLKGQFVEMIACGAQHVAVLTSTAEVFTWGKGANGRLGHGDLKDRDVPVLVEELKDKRTTHVACGASFTAVICQHKWVTGMDHSVCAACKQAFGFTRKRHNCYNCGLVFCHPCSSKKALKASLAPNPQKPYRVCDNCFLKLQKAAETLAAAAAALAAAPHRKAHVNSRQQRLRSVVARTASQANELKPPPLQGKVVAPGDLDLIKSGTVTSGSNTRTLKRGPTPVNSSLPPSAPSGPGARSGRVSPTPNAAPMPAPWGGVTTPSSFAQPYGSAPGLMAPVATTGPVLLSSSLPIQGPPRAVTPPRRGGSPSRAPPLQMPIVARSAPTGPLSPRKSLAPGLSEEMKRVNESLNLEVNKLRTQVKELTARCEQLEMEVASVRAEASAQVEGALAVAAEETARANSEAARANSECARANSATAVVNSLTAQIKEIKDGAFKNSRLMSSKSLPANPIPAPTFPASTSTAMQVAVPAEVNVAAPQRGGPSRSADSPLRPDTSADVATGGAAGRSNPRDASGAATASSAEGSRHSSRAGRHGRSVTRAGTSSESHEDGRGRSSAAGERERVEQVEAGVYITLLSLPQGGNELRRVRFSRKIFSERQAEAWWAENRGRVHATYQIRNADRPSPAPTPGNNNPTPTSSTTTTGLPPMPSSSSYNSLPPSAFAPPAPSFSPDSPNSTPNPASPSPPLLLPDNGLMPPIPPPSLSHATSATEEEASVEEPPFSPTSSVPSSSLMSYPVHAQFAAGASDVDVGIGERPRVDEAQENGGEGGEGEGGGYGKEDEVGGASIADTTSRGPNSPSFRELVGDGQVAQGT